MRKSQIEALAYKAMQDAVADGWSVYAVIDSGAEKFRNGKRTAAECDRLAQALYNQHFTVKEPN